MSEDRRRRAAVIAHLDAMDDHRMRVLAAWLGGCQPETAEESPGNLAARRAGAGSGTSAVSQGTGA